MDYIGVKLHKDRSGMLAFCRRHDRLYLYGNGWVGRGLFQYLEEEGIEIYAFCVSDGHKTENLFCGKAVCELSEISFGENDGIILGVSEVFLREICGSLHSRGISSENIYAQQIYIDDTALAKRKLCPENHKIQKDTYFAGYTVLDRIGREHGTDKCSDEHDYLDKYEFFVDKWKDADITILELGVYHGGSLKMWGAYFANASVYGVDISEECQQYTGENRSVILQDLGDEDGIKALGELHPTIIVDDASHLWSHQIKALYQLFPALQTGGVYIMEDLGTSFFSYDRQYYADAVITAYDFCAALAEAVTGRAPLRTAHLQQALLPFGQEIAELAEQISMVSFIQESCIIIKK